MLVVALMAAGGAAWAVVPASALTVPARPGTPTVPQVVLAGPGVTLDEAVAKVEKQTHGKVLRASSRQYGNATEYRIKVLTPDGHVRVIPVRSRLVHHSAHKLEETH